MYCADEAFFTGTAAEVTPIRELDDRVIGEGSRPGHQAHPGHFFAAARHRREVQEVADAGLTGDNLKTARSLRTHPCKTT
jgi:predicted TIM-barrel enzyme